MTKGSRDRRRLAGLGAFAVAAIAAIVPALRADAAPAATRISGADRYATSAAISASSFDPGVDVAYVATGVNFPDALAGAPAAAAVGGPVLLVPPDSLPSAIATELDRLDPLEIVVIGGPAAVSDAVKTQLEAHTAGPVTRLHGPDRYATAAAVSADTFPPAVNQVFIATGANFPDALSGGPAAAAAPAGGGPLLLVEHGSIPAATVTELQRLAPQEIIVLGGTAVVSDSVVTQLDPYSVDPVTRIAGADRFLTSVGVSASTFASAETVYLATGRNFPDALSGGSPAGIAGGPMLLSEPTCIPEAVNDEITRLDPTSLIVLGGESALSAAVLNRTVCAPPSTTTTGPSINGVTPGAFCAPAGAQGFSNTGTPMTCQTHKCDGTPYDQPRWRSTACP